MTNPNLVEIVCVLDRSGSMQIIVDDAIGSFNAMLSEQQKLPGETRMTLVRFDDEYEEVAVDVPIEMIAPLNRKTYVPRGSTALLDAVGNTINRVGQKLASRPEEQRPGTVLFIILTDGQENASREYTKERVQEMVKHQEDRYAWRFVYLSASLSTFQDARSLGIGSSVLYTASPTGINTAYTLIRDSIIQTRSSGRGCGMFAGGEINLSSPPNDTTASNDIVVDSVSNDA